MAKKTTSNDKDVPKAAHPSPTFPIVGIGASAGGLEAFEQFFTHMPPDSGIAFVLIQHLDPTRKSMLVELIQRYTRMPVRQAKDKLPIEPNCVYVIPPNYDMKLQKHTLRLLKPTAPRGARLTIDFFLRSLASEQKDRAIGIVLSGTGTDGTLGIQTIKGAGGMAMVQLPETARYDGMPSSAIATDLVDFILPPEQMPIYLINFLNQALPNLGRPNESRHVEVDDALRHIFVLLQAHTGYDFSMYKEDTLRRRIERRVVVNQFSKVTDYLDYLQQNPLEVEMLFKELLIGVTNFFRDPEAFEILEHQIIPELLPNPLPKEPVRIWIPGCSSGEEAYSIAILMYERMEHLAQRTKVQIFATDIDPDAVERTRAGLYPDSIEADVSPERLARFFRKEGHRYRIQKSIREMMIISTQNIIQDPPFSRLDLISCRNLLIYFRPLLQKKIIPLFYYALQPDRFLFLGSSESLEEYANLFSIVNKRWKIFQTKPGQNFTQTIPDFSRSRTINNLPKKETPSPTPPKPRDVVEKTLLEDYTPACVLTDELGTIQYIHGRTGTVLEPPSGKVQWNITRLARPGLQIPLTTAIRRAQKEKQTVTYERVKVENDQKELLIRLTVKPILEPKTMAGMLLIIFQRGDSSLLDHLTESKNPLSANSDHFVSDLEYELKSTQEYLHTTVEELESSNEALTAANEELQSSNEELQSTNEELHTAKEELQSVNEELLTVNTELENKIEELTAVNNDMNNLFVDIGVGAIVVDMDLTLRRFTPAATHVAKLIQSDIGRPLSHIVFNLPKVDCAQAAAQVLETLTIQEQEVRHKNGRWYKMRVRPYRTDKNAIDGVTFTFSDITNFKQTQQELINHRHQLQKEITAHQHAQESLLESQLWLKTAQAAAHIGTWERNLITGQIKLSDECMPIYGVNQSVYQTEDFFIQITTENTPAMKAAFHQALGEDGNYAIEHLIQRQDNGEMRWVQSQGKVIVDSLNNPLKIIGITQDITQRKMEELALQESEAFITAITTTVPDIIYVYDVQQNCNVYFNKQFTEILGYTDKEITSFNNLFVEMLIHPEDVHATRKHLERIAADQANNVYQNIYRTKHANGTWRWLFSRDTPFKRDAAGKVVQIIGTARDISKHKPGNVKGNSYGQLPELILEKIDLGYYEHALPLDNTTYYSSEWAKMLGYTLDELPAPNQSLEWIFEQIHPDDRSLLQQAYDDFIEGKNPSYDVVTRIKHKSGQWITVRETSRVLARNHTGRIVRVLGIMQMLEKE
ncbi:MAG: PAS domain-containing protein [Anaerolineae bacterium]|nr:PAS domain-containing protein [Anaerolineae bacterium]